MARPTSPSDERAGDPKRQRTQGPPKIRPYVSVGRRRCNEDSKFKAPFPYTAPPSQPPSRTDVLDHTWSGPIVHDEEMQDLADVHRFGYSRSNEDCDYEMKVNATEVEGQQIRESISGSGWSPYAPRVSTQEALGRPAVHRVHHSASPVESAIPSGLTPFNHTSTSTSRFVGSDVLPQTKGNLPDNRPTLMRQTGIHQDIGSSSLKPHAASQNLSGMPASRPSGSTSLNPPVNPPAASQPWTGISEDTVMLPVDSGQYSHNLVAASQTWSGIPTPRPSGSTSLNPPANPPAASQPWTGISEDTVMLSVHSGSRTSSFHAHPHVSKNWTGFHSNASTIEPPTNSRLLPDPLLPGAQRWTGISEDVSMLPPPRPSPNAPNSGPRNPTIAQHRNGIPGQSSSNTHRENFRPADLRPLLPLSSGAPLSEPTGSNDFDFIHRGLLRTPAAFATHQDLARVMQATRRPQATAQAPVSSRGQLGLNDPPSEEDSDDDSKRSHFPVHRQDATNQLHAQIRDYIDATLLGLKNKPCPKPLQVPSPTQIADFVTDPTNKPGPDIDDLKLDLAGNSLKSSLWNKAAAVLIVDRLQGGNEHPSIKRLKPSIVTKAVETHFRQLRTRYLKQLNTNADEHDKILEEKQEQIARRSQRQRRVYTRRIEGVLRVLKFIQNDSAHFEAIKAMLQQATCDIMSGDESDNGFGLHTITTPVWRSTDPSVVQFFNVLDGLYMSSRFQATGKPKPRAFPVQRLRMRNPKVVDSPPVPGLPRNFYDEAYLKKIGRLEVAKLKLKEPISLEFSQEILQ
ncbi:hypothetical protein ONZ45_g15851 [Pleurotus djamor]|nr:hypothetical protein ONZ45_g15851 [Pleurotus djamor]